MGLCQNVYRRGALYWWRRRFPDPTNGRSRTIAISLGVREPIRARRLGATLNARAYAIANQLGSGVRTFEDARKDLTVVVDNISWCVSADAIIAPRIGAPHSGPEMTRDQQVVVLRAMVEDAEAEIRKGASANRLRIVFDGSGRPLDPEREARSGEIALAAIYRAIAEGGRAAVLRDDLAASLMKAAGKNVCGFVERQIAHMAENEDLNGDRWLLGPPRSVFERNLIAAECEPTLDAIRLIRRDYLLVCASLLEDGTRWAPSASVADEVLGAFSLRKTPAAPERQQPPIVASPTEPTASDATTSYRDTLLRQAAPQPPVRLMPKTMTQHVEDLIKSKKRPVDKNGIEIPRTKGWDVKTASQHRSIARMLVKLAGTDDPHEMDQTLLGAYRLLLNDLPKNWGKSPDDLNRSIEDIVTRAQDLEEHEVGLAGTTIDRHMTQLSNIVSYLTANGLKIGDVTGSMRVGGESQQRGIFTIDELDCLFRSSVWTGCAGKAGRHIAGDVVIKDALYWVPILARYELLRLAELTGLMIADVDFSSPALFIKDNSERRLKTLGATRRQPIVPEVLRLGFLNYATTIREAGHDLLFPCLRQRGENTPLSNFFYKDFKKILVQFLPHAAEQRKSFHSLRKDGNTLMANANVNDPIRHAVMGHAHGGVNEKHYLDAIYDSAKLEALGHISINTGHL